MNLELSFYMQGNSDHSSHENSNHENSNHVSNSKL